MLTTMDIAWAAGLIEGEGCFPCQNGRYSIQVSMTDPDVMGKLATLFGTKTYGPYQCYSPTDSKKAGRAAWRIYFHGPRAIGWMMTIYSFMGERRRAAIEKSIGRWKNSPGRGRRGIPRYAPIIPECHPNEPHSSRGLCNKCYRRLLRKMKKDITKGE